MNTTATCFARLLLLGWLLLLVHRPLFGGQGGVSKVQRAARQAYLDADARSYGAIVSTAAQTDRDTAAALFDFINSQDRYVQGLQMQDLTVLPVGMKLPTPGGNGSIEMGILRASFFPNNAMAIARQGLSLARQARLDVSKYQQFIRSLPVSSR